ncbi:MAG: type II toxin-antitoxin system Phd/YefM family antitoxin [Planctomycetes bacterium]|nr:type II toxin-antitoxin system Phd/YefM family antitoxin [Planctomycetota bacterium]
MKIVKIADAKAHLSRYLDHVRRGGRVRILDRSTPVADLVPVEADGGGEGDEALLAMQERRGLVRRGKRGPMPKELLQAGPGGPRAGVLDALLAERRESR